MEEFKSLLSNQGRKLQPDDDDLNCAIFAASFIYEVYFSGFC